jgi:uncharacterized protein
MNEIPFPPFRPHPLFPGGHAQTLAGAFLPGKQYPYQAHRHQVTLDDGDILVLHDDVPKSWSVGDRTALLIHGLAGSHLSSYMVRISARLNAIGYRTFRMDLRTCGAGCGLARRPYHAGRSDDARAAVEFITDQCPGSTCALVGFSLGGNIVLKLLGENPMIVPKVVTRAAAINPSADLSACVNALVGPLRGMYDRHFATLLNRQLVAARLTPETLAITIPYRPRRIIEFDDLYTAQVWGFGTAAHYYERSSSAPHVAKIEVPTLILAARDDPMVPVGTLEKLAFASTVRLHIADHGGHMGYVGLRGSDPDRRWMDWRIVDWLNIPLAPG